MINLAHDKFYGLCKNKCLVEINADNVGAAKTDLSNIDNTVFAEKATEAGVCDSYDDTELKNRVSTLEATIGTLNDSLEGALNGNGG